MILSPGSPPASHPLLPFSAPALRFSHLGTATMAELSVQSMSSLNSATKSSNNTLSHAAAVGPLQRTYDVPESPFMSEEEEEAMKGAEQSNGRFHLDRFYCCIHFLCFTILLLLVLIYDHFCSSSPPPPHYLQLCHPANPSSINLPIPRTHSHIRMPRCPFLGTHRNALLPTPGTSLSGGALMKPHDFLSSASQIPKTQSSASAALFSASSLPLRPPDPTSTSVRASSTVSTPTIPPNSLSHRLRSVEKVSSDESESESPTVLHRREHHRLQHHSYSRNSSQGLNNVSHSHSPVRSQSGEYSYVRRSSDTHHFRERMGSHTGDSHQGQSRERENERYKSRDTDRDRDRKNDREKDRSRYLDRAYSKEREREYRPERDRNRSRYEDKGHSRERERARGKERDRDGSRYQDRDRDKVGEKDLDKDHGKDHGRAHGLEDGGEHLHQDSAMAHTLAETQATLPLLENKTTWSNGSYLPPNSSKTTQIWKSRSRSASPASSSNELQRDSQNNDSDSGSNGNNSDSCSGSSESSNEDGEPLLPDPTEEDHWTLSTETVYQVRITSRMPPRVKESMILDQFGKYSALRAYRDDNGEWLIDFPSQAARNDAVYFLQNKPALGINLRLQATQRTPAPLSKAERHARRLRCAVVAMMITELQQAAAAEVQRVCVDNVIARGVRAFLEVCVTVAAIN